MSDKVSTIALRAIACDIEDCEQPQSWADAMRAAVSEIEKLRAALRLYADDNYNGYNGNGAHARAALGEKK